MEEIPFAKELGADVVIDYKTQKFEESIKDYDAAYDTVGKDTYTRSYHVLKRGGIIVSMLEQPNQELAEKLGVRAIAQQTTITTEKLTKLAELVDQDIVKPQIDKVFPLEQITQAYTYRETSHPKGKVVVEIKRSSSD